MTVEPLIQAAPRVELDRFRDDIREHYATKADLKDLEARLTWRMFGAVLGGGTLVGVSVTVADRLAA